MRFWVRVAHGGDSTLARAIDTNDDISLIAEIAKLPGVRVISRTSVMQFKGAKTPLRRADAREASRADSNDVFQALGMYERVVEEADRILAAEPDCPWVVVRRWSVAWARRASARRLDEADYRERHRVMPIIAGVERLAPLRAEPRFIGLVRKLKLPAVSG